MIIFAVETSCDETSICILNDKKEILSHIIYSQSEHIIHGGVVPELASRSHLLILQKITKKALLKAKIDITNIDIFCATVGPGLIGGLLVGSTFAKALAIGNKKPFIPINHLEGHILSPTFNNNIKFPYLCFLLTGGHTQIYIVHSIGNYELLGETLDDAIGEAFDKVAKLLMLSYPGGPEIEKNAKNGDVHKFKLPHPLEKNKNLNFSFSGIKTAVNLIVKNEKKISNIFVQDISASFQYTITNILESKMQLAIKNLQKRDINFSEISLVGGVAANKYIHKRLTYIAKKNECSVVMPLSFMLSDNAAMIGWACLQKNQKNFNSDLFFKPNPKLSINN